MQKTKRVATVAGSNRTVQSYAAFMSLAVFLFVIYYYLHRGNNAVPINFVKHLLSHNLSGLHDYKTKSNKKSTIYQRKEPFSLTCRTALKNRFVNNGHYPPQTIPYSLAFENIYKPLNYSLTPNCTTQPWLGLVKNGQNAPNFCSKIFTSWIKTNKIKPKYPPVKWPTPSQMPKYTMNNFSEMSRWYFNDVTGNSRASWGKGYIDTIIDKVNNKQTTGYGKDSLMVYKAIASLNLTGKRAAVIGTIYPWMEAALLLANVSQVTTIEYSKISISGRPRMKSMLPLEAAKRTMNGTLEPFDFVGSFSSIEHSGLGRFGDVLDPNGDLMEMLKCWCWLKPGGYMLFGGPIGQDHIAFNAHRIYGPLRLPLITAGFEIISIFGPKGRMRWNRLTKKEFIFAMPPGTPLKEHYQRVIVLRKTATDPKLSNKLFKSNKFKKPTKVWN